MIWGMTLEPGKLYTEIMGEEVQLSMAAIDSRKDLDESTKSFCQIVMKTSKGEYVLCTLVHGVMFQQTLDLKLMPREKVTFSVQGPSVVYLVGYTASYPEDEELDLEDEVEADENSSAWESFDAEEELQVEQIKEEPVEIADDIDEAETTLSTEDVYKGEEELPNLQQSQQEQTTEMEDAPQEEREEEIIFSVAELETTEMKTEAPTPKPASSPPSSQVQQMPPPQDMYSIQTSNTGSALDETGPNSDYFYPETQQQPDVAITPPVSYQTTTTSPDFQQQNPQGSLLPASAPDSFVPPQKTYVQRAQPVQHRQVVRGSVQQMNTQRTYPPQRRQYGTNRNQPASKTRLQQQQQRQPVNVQQVRNISNIQQQQSIPGTSQQDMPGPSTSGPGRQIVPARQLTGHYPVDLASLPASRANWSPRASGIRAVNSPKSGKKATTGGARRKPLLHPDAGQLGVVPVPTICRYCGKQFENLAKYKAHEIYHTKPPRFPCRYCGKPNHSKANMLRHERTHTGEKPFKCRFCKKSFPFKETLTSHERLHTGEKPFKCRTCGKRFTHGATCRRHEAANNCFN